MRPTLFALAVLGLLAIASMPTGSAAVHGVAWKADGVAVSTSGAVYLVNIAFTGTVIPFLCPPTYTVTLRDATGAIVDQRIFRGYQNQLDGPGQGVFIESFTNNGGSLDPAVQFTYAAYQVATVQFALVDTLSQAIVGTYQGMQFSAVTVAYLFDFDCTP